MDAIKVGLMTDGTAALGQMCVSAELAFTWMPTKFSTFLMSPMQIEVLIGRIGHMSTADTLEADKRQLLQDAITNWQTVLATYRSLSKSNDPADTRTVERALDDALVGVRDTFTKMVGDGSSDYSAADQEMVNDLDGDAKNVDEHGFMPYHPLLGKGFSDFGAEMSVLLEPVSSFFGDIFKDIGDSYAAPYARRKLQADAKSKFDNLRSHVDSGVDSACGQQNAYGQLTALCEHYKQLDSKMTVVDNVLGLCENGGRVEDEHVARFCEQASITFDGVTDTLSAFDALSNNLHLVTFAGGAGLSMAYTVEKAQSYDMDVEFEFSKARESIYKGDNTVNILGIQLIANLDVSGEQKMKVSMGRSTEQGQKTAHTVHIHFDDPDAYDFFAVQIREDVHYQTPIFTTIGGISSCPGETATQRRDSGVTIGSINHKCGVNHDEECNEQTLLRPTDVAYLGLTLENLSESLFPPCSDFSS